MMVGVLDQLGKPHGEFDPFAQLLGAGAIGWRRSTQPLHPRQQDLQVLLQEPLAECRIRTRAGKVGVGNRQKRAHIEALALKSEGNMA